MLAADGATLAQQRGRHARHVFSFLCLVSTSDNVLHDDLRWPQGSLSAGLLVSLWW